MNDSFRDSSSEIKKKRKKQKMIVSIASGLAITIALSIGTWSFLNRDSLSSDISIHRAEESIVTEEIQSFFDDVKYIEVQLREQGLSDSLIKSTLDMYVNFNMPKDFLAVYQQQASEIVAEEESVIDLEAYKDDEVVQMFWNALNENPNITDDEREFIRTNFSSMVYNYKDKLSVIDIVNDVHKMKIVYDSNSCVDNGENVEGTYTWSDKLITIYNSTSFEDAKKTALSHEFNHLLLGPFLGRYRWLGEGYTSITNPINDTSYSREKLMLIGYLEIFGDSFFKECFDLSYFDMEDFEFFETYFEPVNVFLEKRKNNQLTEEDKVQMLSSIKECYSLFRDDDFDSNPVMNVCEDFIMGTNKSGLFEGTSLPDVSLEDGVLKFFNIRRNISYRDSSGASYSLSAIDTEMQEIPLSSYNEKRNLGKS